jgi:hypothetical protein
MNNRSLPVSYSPLAYSVFAKSPSQIAVLFAFPLSSAPLPPEVGTRAHQVTDVPSQRQAMPHTCASPEGVQGNFSHKMCVVKISTRCGVMVYEGCPGPAASDASFTCV